MRARHRARLIFTRAFVFNGFMRADFRISVKDFARKKTLKVQLMRLPFGRQFFVRMNGERWPRDGRPVSLSRVFASLRKALVRTQLPRTTLSHPARAAVPASRAVRA